MGGLRVASGSLVTVQPEVWPEPPWGTCDEEKRSAAAAPNTASSKLSYCSLDPRGPGHSTLSAHRLASQGLFVLKGLLCQQQKTGHQRRTHLSQNILERDRARTWSWATCPPTPRPHSLLDAQGP